MRDRRSAAAPRRSCSSRTRTACARSSAQSLSEQGYAVARGGRAAEALAICESDPRIDLLVTDVVMPGMNGHELATQLVARRPDLQVLFMSGYSSDDALSRQGARAGHRLPAEAVRARGMLAAKVRELLDAPSVSAPLLAA